MRKTLLSMLALGVLLGAANLCPAQTEMKPVVTVSFSGYDKTFADVGAIGKLGGKPGLGKELEMIFAGILTQGKGLDGLDSKRPWGAVVLTDGQQKFPVYGFIPVTDLKKLTQALRANPLVSVTIQSNKEVYEIRVRNVPPLFVQQKGAWAFIATASEALAQAPADPLKLLGDLPEKFNLAVRTSFKNVPPMIREAFLSSFQASLEKGMAQNPTESDAEYEGRMASTKLGTQLVVTLVKKLDELVLGWNISSSANTTNFDFEMTALPGTNLAKEFAQMKPGKTNFAGVLMPDAAIAANGVGPISETTAAWIKGFHTLFHKVLLKELESQGLSEEQLKVASKLMGDVIGIIEKTIDSKKSDCGMVLLLNPGEATLVGGATVVDGDKLENVLKQLAEEVKKIDPKIAKLLALNTETHEGVRFSTISIPAPDDKVAALVGDNLNVIIGVADDQVWLAAGRDAAETLKKVIDQSKATAGKEVPPMRVAISLRTVAKFIAVVAEDERVKAQASLFAGHSSMVEKDHVNITTMPVTNGIRVRLEVEEGVLAALISIAVNIHP